MGIAAVDCHERYLGLPCFTGRKKKEIFSDISSRIWDKIKGWRDKFLSVGGKEILIKAVVQSIPSYAMNLFQLPKGLLNEIFHLCARFWWGRMGIPEKFIGVLGLGCTILKKKGVWDLKTWKFLIKPFLPINVGE